MTGCCRLQQQVASKLTPRPGTARWNSMNHFKTFYHVNAAIAGLIWMQDRHMPIMSKHRRAADGPV